MKQTEVQYTASELINSLKILMERDGDLPVRFIMNESSDEEYGDSHPACGIVTMTGDEDKPSYFMIGDNTVNEMD